MTHPSDDVTSPGRARSPLGSGGRGESEAMRQVWERRFGSQPPERFPSGHHRYVDSDVARLRLVTELVTHGENPRGLLDLSLGDLELRAAQAAQAGNRLSDHSELDQERAVRFVEALDGDGLLDQLLEVGCSREACAFIERDLGPLLVEIDQRCSVRALDLSHRHLATETIKSLLHQLKARMMSSAQSKHVKTQVTVILSGIRGERNELPLHLAAHVAELAGARCVVAGCNSSPEQIVKAAERAKADVVGLHSSIVATGGSTEDFVLRVRDGLADSVRISLDGPGFAGLRRLPARTARPSSLKDFEGLIAELVSG